MRSEFWFLFFKLLFCTKFIIGEYHHGTDCSATDCVSCTTDDAQYYIGSASCEWVINDPDGKQFCRSKKKHEETLYSVSGARTISFEDQCPIDDPEVVPELAFWMETTFPVIGNMSLLDLSLPGTHDSLTYDLSLVTSDGGIDDHNLFAELMHNYSFLIPNGIEDFIRQQAMTQGLNITGQLDAGVRFIDLRIMEETTEIWRSLHFLQSHQTALNYLSQIKDWLVGHPKEIVVVWLSKHGSECKTGTDQYPNVSVEAKQRFWSEIVSLFNEMITDFSITKINETSIESMITRNHRLVVYAADWEEFTGGTNGLGKYALDSCLVDNQLGPSVTDIQSSQQWMTDSFQNADERKKEDKKNQKLYLMR